jgi:ATP-dependent Lhr-like helicase
VARRLLQHMIREEILWEDAGILWFGPRGEKEFGRRNFLELLSVFCSPLQIQVRYGNTDIGNVDPLSLRREDDQPTILQRIFQPRNRRMAP